MSVSMVRFIMRRIYNGISKPSRWVTLPDLRVNIGSLELANPVMTASGTFGYAREFENLMNLHRLGAVIVKGISLHPRAGNPPQRIVETACGMLNAIGLQNVGVDRFIAEKMNYLVRTERSGYCQHSWRFPGRI